MSSTTPSPSTIPEPAAESAPERLGEPIADPTTEPAMGHGVRPRSSDPPRHPHRTRQIVSIALIVAGFALLIVTLRAQDLGLAPAEGASWTQVTTGVIGTILLVTGLALIVQAFEDSDEPL